MLRAQPRALEAAANLEALGVAGSESIAWASFASSLSKHGSPSPTGTPVATHFTTLPIESSAAFTTRTTEAMRAAVGALGQRTLTTSSVAWPVVTDAPSSSFPSRS